jgi:hypothetical protein
MVSSRTGRHPERRWWFWKYRFINGFIGRPIKIKIKELLWEN